jgi:hypothetical protein
MSNSYYTLVASLPALPARFEVDRLPISLVRLEERLHLLEPEDAEVVAELRHFLFWDRHRRNWSDDEVVEWYDRRAGRLSNPMAREIVEFRMDTRTILSGLRRRRLGLEPPPGVGQWAPHIRRKWKLRDFGLGWRYPWIVEIDDRLGTGRELEIHRMLLDQAWQHWRRLTDGYTFEFEVVLLYLARWEIISRWVELNSERGLRRFEALIEEATREHSDLYN